MDLVEGRANLVHSGAHVVSDVALDVQLVDGQAGPVWGALDLVLAGPINDGLLGVKQQVSKRCNQIYVVMVVHHQFNVSPCADW